MAQTTSALWKTLWRTKGTEREYQFDIAGKIYGPDVEVSHSVDNGLYEKFGIGNAATAKFTMSLFADDIPRAATIKRYIRLRNGEQVTEWLPKGVFFANRRGDDDGYWTIEAFDAMRKAEQSWEPDQSLNFPMSMPDAVAEFARIMGVEIDPRTQLNPAYTIDYPASDPESETGDYYSIRQELQWIAAAHGGNWIVTGEGRLLLVPLLSIPEETNYLVTEYGGAITLGGVRILVSPIEADFDSKPAKILSTFDKHFVGLDLTGVEDNGRQRPISRITLLVDDENAVTAGDDTGLELTAPCPYATQAMVNAILSQVKGYRYQMLSAGDAGLDPAAELGDGITAGGVYSVISRLSDDGGGYPSITAPGEAELEDEYPAAGPMSREFDRKIAETRSSITKTAEQIRLEVANELQGLSASFTVELNGIKGQVTGLDGQISTLEQTANSITTEISYMGQDISRIEQKVDNIRLEVSNGETSSWISLYAGSVEISSQKIQFTGDVVFESDLLDGYTTISGNCIRTGEVSAEYIKLGGEMTVYESLGVNNIGGFIGYLESENYHGNTTYGIGILNYNRAYQVVVTDNGARLTSPTSEIVAAVNITLDTSRNINASTEITVTSDRRKKDEIRYDVEKYFPVFDRLKPCSFLRKDGGNQRHLGFIAQEYLESEAAAGISRSDSVIISETNGYYGISYGEVVPLLVAEVQKLNNRVKELEKWKS